MPNPFTFYPKPANSKEAQSNANHSYYNLMEAQERLQEADAAGDRAAGIAASHDVHTCKWVNKEYQYEARKMRAAETTA